MPRKVVVATASLRRTGRRRSVEEHRAAAERLLERAASHRPDIVCLPETFTALETDAAAGEAAEPVPGPTTARLGALACRHGMYVVSPLLERDGGHIYNTAVLLNRRGDVVGRYRKLHPTISELEQGISPGERVAIFATDFGRISVLICFDLMFPAAWREVKELGAELVFWPSAYEGGLPLAARAAEHEYYVVSCCPVWHSRILDITGYELASTGQRTEIVSAAIDLEKRVFSTDYNMRQYDAIVAKYGRRVALHVLSPEGVFTLESHDPALTVAEIASEFGLETQEDYFRRSATAQQQARRLAKTGDGLTPARDGIGRERAVAGGEADAQAAVMERTP